MSDPNSSGPHPVIDDDEEYDDRGTSQADDPTAVWDEDALAKLGVDINRKAQSGGKERQRDTDPPAAGPAAGKRSDGG